MYFNKKELGYFDSHIDICLAWYNGPVYWITKYKGFYVCYGLGGDLIVAVTKENLKRYFLKEIKFIDLVKTAIDGEFQEVTDTFEGDFSEIKNLKVSDLETHPELIASNGEFYHENLSLDDDGDTIAEEFGIDRALVS